MTTKRYIVVSAHSTDQHYDFHVVDVLRRSIVNSYAMARHMVDDICERMNQEGA